MSEVVDSNKKLTITVDVEDFFNPRPPSNMYFANIGKSYFGITKIMDICEQFNFKATFFVDVHNVENYVDDSLLREACQEINNRGHEVGLHTHPPRINEKNYVKGRVLRNYDFDYQYKFIHSGAEKIHKWINDYPKSHRAGSYGANLETFAALQKSQILIDSSVFWKYFDYNLPNENDLYEKISPFFIDRVLEIPIMSFNLNITLFNKIYLFNLLKKTDINWCSVYEFQKIMKDNTINRLEIFLHSYSFMNIKSWKPNNYFIENFIELLKYLKGSKYESVLVKDFPFDENEDLRHFNLKMDLFEFKLKDLNELYLSKLNISNLLKYI